MSSIWRSGLERLQGLRPRAEKGGSAQSIPPSSDLQTEGGGRDKNRDSELSLPG